MTMDGPLALSAPEVRVLGALMEKARTTPELYPLTLNALVLACNQKTSRDPVTDYEEQEVLDTLDRLREKGLAMRVDLAGSRAPRFRENASTAWQLERPEYALLATLFLRGPQTPGQLRQRCERLQAFAELGQVTDWLQRMQQREEKPHTLVRPLDRLSGTKELRYAEVLGPLPEPAPEAEAAPRPAGDSLRERLQQLEERVSQLERQLEDLLG